MSAMNSDQLHRSTLAIYSNLMDEFNPSLQKLVLLGNSYVQAFKALCVTSEAYFSALSRVGQRASHTASSHSLGDVLIRISENQRMLTSELEKVFRWFSVEVLQEMDNNVRLDVDFIAGSRKHYEMEVHSQATALDRQLRRGANQDCGEYVHFLRTSYEEALKEEERRHRFLAEKHCGLIQAIAQLMNKTVDSLQQRADSWAYEVDATRAPDARRPTSTGVKEEIRRSREESTLGSVPSRAPSPQGSVYGSKAGSVGGGSGGAAFRARASHQPSASKPTLLPFARGETITVLVQQPRNGWLYGCDGSSRQGWFPASFVEPVDDPPKATSSGSSTLRSSSSASSLSDLPWGGSHGGAPPPPPPPPPLPSPSRASERQQAAASPDRRVESNAENKRSKPHASQPELFPRGTNPFATVKLKPTLTNDRSSPHFTRR